MSLTQQHIVSSNVVPPHQSPSPDFVGKIKPLKRCRQRVDAGEPRNTYSSLPGQSVFANVAAMAVSAELDDNKNLLPLSDDATDESTGRVSKRKQYQPVQISSEATLDDEEENGLAEHKSPVCSPSPRAQSQPTTSPLRRASPIPADDSTVLQQPYNGSDDNVQRHLLNMQQRYLHMLEKQRSMVAPPMEQFAGQSTHWPPLLGMWPKPQLDSSGMTAEAKQLAKLLKSELASVCGSTIEKVVADFVAQQVRALSARMAEQPNPPQPSLAEHLSQPNIPPFYIPSSFYSSAPPLSGMPITASIFPTPFLPPVSNPAYLCGSFGSGTPQSDEAISLVLPKKKRSKVTDTRITKLSSSPKLFNDSLTLFNGSPTMVNGDGTTTTLRSPNCSPPQSLDGDGSMYEAVTGMNQSNTLTPMHLRKAKLMFFYTRYPSSSLLKAYFPDIRFNKNNTAQLVKWFSNFREFFYIQVEKYARQALAEGIRTADDITVTCDSEIHRILNLHYNRNGHIPVPQSFTHVIQAALREFFKSIQANRDTEASWKKMIYKIINRLDETIPEYFKQSKFLEQLEG